MQTLNDFFGIQSTSLEWASGVTGTPVFKQAQQQMAGELIGAQLLPKNFYEYLVVKLHKALNIDFGRLLVWGWRTNNEISAYRDKKNPPGDPYMVDLVKHTIKSSHSPVIKLKVNGNEIGKLKFDIVARLTIKGFTLVIDNGKIMEIKTGTCVGIGSIEYSGFAFIKRETAPITLPGSIPFKEGFPI